MTAEDRGPPEPDDEWDDDEDSGDNCGRWDQNAPGGMSKQCRLAGTEFCDWECPYGRRYRRRGMPERLIFHEEARSGQHLRVVLSGKLDARLLDALDSYMARQRVHLGKMTDVLETEAFEWSIEGE